MTRNSSRFQVTNAKIARIVRRLVTQFHPEKIILFGSWARGNAGPESDVDLLVVMRYAGSRRAKQVELRNAIYRVQCPKDVVVATPDELIRKRYIAGTIVRSATEEGKVLYEKSR
jgi:predicted nucleotidyltransferase